MDRLELAACSLGTRRKVKSSQQSTYIEIRHATGVARQPGHSMNHKNLLIFLILSSVRLSSIILALLFSHTCFGQLAGIYYMGGDDPDFYNIDQLFNSLATQGTSDTVIVNVRAGSYIPVDTDMSSFESDFPVIVQSENLNRDSVTWNASNVQINFSFPGDLHFKHITFDAYDSNAGAVKFWNSESLRFDTCRFVAFPGNNNSEAIRITSTTEKVEFYGCEMIGGDSEIRGSPGIFKHNAVYSDVNFEGAWEDISENKFHFWAKLPSASDIFDNRFYDDVALNLR